jgi:hypothetical protein
MQQNIMDGGCPMSGGRIASNMNELTIEKKAKVVSLPCEDCRIRGIERITGIHRDTIMRLGVRIGETCADTRLTNAFSKQCFQQKD